MSNPFRGEARLGDVILKLDVNALCTLEESGESFDALAQKAEGGSFLAMRRLVHALMQRHQPKAALADAGDLIGAHGPEAIGAALARIVEAQGDAAREAEAPPPANPPAPAG